MESLFIQGTERTPEFNFDIDNFFIALTGHSKIKKTDSFYLNITEYIEKIEKIKPIRLNIEFNLNSICRNSKRGILFFLLRIKEVQMHINTEITINWLYKHNNDLVKVDLTNKRVDLLVEDDEINQRVKNNKFKYPPNHTPWQEIAREYVGQLGEGACLDLKEKYLDIAKEKGIPRDNH